MPLFKRHVGMLEALRKPPTLGWFPECATCNRYVDSVNIVEMHKTTAKVLARHHGAEELATFELGTEDYDEDDITRALRGHRWFDPTTPEK